MSEITLHGGISTGRLTLEGGFYGPLLKSCEPGTHQGGSTVFTKPIKHTPHSVPSIEAELNITEKSLKSTLQHYISNKSQTCTKIFKRLLDHFAAEPGGNDEFNLAMLQPNMQSGFQWA